MYGATYNIVIKSRACECVYVQRIHDYIIYGENRFRHYFIINFYLFIFFEQKNYRDYVQFL